MTFKKFNYGICLYNASFQNPDNVTTTKTILLNDLLFNNHFSRIMKNDFIHNSWESPRGRGYIAYAYSQSQWTYVFQKAKFKIQFNGQGTNYNNVLDYIPLCGINFDNSSNSLIWNIGTSTSYFELDCTPNEIDNRIGNIKNGNNNSLIINKIVLNAR